MKKLLVLLLYAAKFSFGQEAAIDSRFEAGYIFGDAQFNTGGLVGSGSKSTNKFSGYGVSGVFGIDKHWSFETGLSYYKLDYTLYGAAGLNIPPTSEDLSFLSLPLKARFSLGKYVYFNGGLLVDFELENSNGVEKQSGIGFSIGAGGKYDLSNGLGFFVNPQLNTRRIFSGKKGSVVERLNEASVQAGLAYSF